MGEVHTRVMFPAPHSVDVDGLFEGIDLDPCISIDYLNTHEAKNCGHDDERFFYT